MVILAHYEMDVKGAAAFENRNLVVDIGGSLYVLVNSIGCLYGA